MPSTEGAEAEDPRQWRIDNARRLKGLTLHFKRYTAWSETWQHDHCTACWATLAEYEGPNILHEGYATGPDYPKGENYAWVCSKCFHELADALGWTSASSADGK